MDLKTFGAVFAAIFVAELADKTQLVGISMTAKSGKPFTVMAASVSAYLIITALSVTAGAFLARYIRPEYIRYGGGSIFVIIGVLMMLQKG